jgi:hypothetical protein
MVIFSKSSHFYKKMKPYVEKYLFEKGNEDIYDKLDYAALNIFMRLYSIFNRPDFNDYNHQLEKKYRAINSAGGFREPEFSTKSWHWFYMRLVLRRVFILWDANFDSFDSSNVKRNLSGTDKMDRVSFLIQHGNTLFDENTSKTQHIKEVCMIKLGFEKPNHSIKYDKLNSFEDEKRFLRKYPIVKIKNIISFTEGLNLQYFKDNTIYPNVNGLSFDDFWDLKEFYTNSELIGKAEFENFKNDISSELSEFSDLDDSFKLLFMDNKITSITNLF